MEKSLFISSFDSLLYQVYGAARHHWGLGSHYVWHYALLSFLSLLLAMLWCRFRQRLHPRWRYFSMAAIVVCLVRSLLFDNPLVWHAYMHAVPEDTLSYLTAKHKAEEIKNRELSPRKLNYLIVGSSLTKTALNAYVDIDPNSRLLFIYGMRVMELTFCERKIESFNPSRVLLYMTNYDLANVTWDEKYDLFYSFCDLKFGLHCGREKRPFISNRLKISMRKSLAGYLFWEYRYAFIFRAYLENWLGRPVPKKDSGKTPEEFLKFKIDGQKRAIGYFSKSNVEMNLFFLNEFFRFCREHHIDVIMLEGNINPLAETPKSRELGLWAMGRLKDMADQYDHVRFVPASALKRLGPEDFKDIVHVKEESSPEYSQSVMNYLQKMPPFPDR